MRLNDQQDDKDLEDVSSDASDNTLDDAADGMSEADAGSSSAETDEKEAEKSTLDVVRDVVGEKKDDAAAAASSADGDEDAGGDAGGSSSRKEQDNENFTDVPFHKHPRFKQLIIERNGLRQDAERHRNVQNFLDTHALGSDEAANALVIFAQAKTDPVGAWAAIKPWVQELLVAAGEVVPADLQARIDKGELAIDTAMEISRERAKSKSATSRQSFAEQQRERQSRIDQANELSDTAESWEADRVRLDPNYDAKRVPLRKEIAYLHSTEGKPTTKDGVLDQLKRAYKAVNDALKLPSTNGQQQRQQAQQQQRKPAIKPVTGGTVSGSAREAPKTTLDIIRANRRQAAG